ncbi:MAG TPA: DUF4232 domain-containing protein [Gaiellales bacterium]|jgi:hypothetical protein|nr:DUF4232 domain-containing protein [Gaiellales bacterium]
MNQVHRKPRAPRRLLAAGAAAAAVVVVSMTYLTTAGAQTGAAATPRCQTRDLAVWLGLGAGGAQAGSASYPLELTNVSGRRCQLYGYPGVSALVNGKQAGSPAARDHAVASTTVTLAAGATAHTLLRITDVSALPGCTPVTAQELRVYPPGAVTPAEIAFRFRACSSAGPRYLSVQAVQPRVGVPGHP